MIPAHWLAALAERTVLSLDVFDTALIRLVHRPADLFTLVERAYIDIHAASGFGFAAERAAAEQRARRQAAAQGGTEEEVTLDEIYSEMRLPPGWSAVKLQTLELEYERRMVRRNEWIHGLYQEARRRDLRIVFVSDMYLPREFIAALLHDNGYDQYERLFVSSGSRLNKRSGSIWSHLGPALGVSNQVILHVGDNQWSDVQSPRQAGIAALRYPFDERPAPPARSPAQSVARALIRRKFHLTSAPTALDFWYRLGYETAGILYLGYVQWLCDSFAADHVDHVYFLARDGYVLQKVYERLRQAGVVAPPSTYLYASRRAFYIPSFIELDDHALRSLTASSAALTVAKLLERAGLDAATHAAEVAAAGFDGLHAIVADSDAQARLRTLFQRLEQPLLTAAAAERAALGTYLDQEQLFARKRPALVDIGWHASLQGALQRLAHEGGRPFSAIGYYLGTFSMRQAGDSLATRGWLFHDDQPQQNSELVRTCVEIFEFLHLAPHSSVLRFAVRDGVVAPVFGVDDATALKHQAAERVQRGALDFIDDFIDAAGDALSWLRADRECAVEPIARLIERPTRHEAEHLGELTHTDGFGFVDARPIARPLPWRNGLNRPLALYEDYHRAFWKEGYAVRLLGDSTQVHHLMRLVRTARTRFSKRRLYYLVKDTVYNTTRAISPRVVASLAQTFAQRVNSAEERLGVVT